MANPAGESNGEAFRLEFDRRLTFSLQYAVSGSNLGRIEASIWRISIHIMFIRLV